MVEVKPYISYEEAVAVLEEIDRLLRCSRGHPLLSFPLGATVLNGPVRDSGERWYSGAQSRRLLGDLGSWSRAGRQRRRASVLVRPAGLGGGCEPELPATPDELPLWLPQQQQ